MAYRPTARTMVRTVRRQPELRARLLPALVVVLMGIVAVGLVQDAAAPAWVTSAIEAATATVGLLLILLPPSR